MVPHCSIDEAVERDACLDDGSRRTALPQPGKEAKLCFIGHGLMRTAMAFWLMPV